MATRVAMQAHARRRKHRAPRHKQVRWVDGGDGLVRKKTTYTRKGPSHTNPGAKPLPRPQHPKAPKTAQPMGVYKGKFGRLQAKRLLDRAGFGPRRGEAEALAKKGLKAAVHSLTRPSGKAKLRGPAPVDGDGNPIAPTDNYGHDSLWWLDRMVRSNQPFVERMSLIFHDWFATSEEKVGSAKMMMDQSNLFRSHYSGSFLTLLEDVTKDPAMLVWLDGIYNSKYDPNENYGREVMELFTLGAERDAYTEDDVRAIARAFTGWDVDYDDDIGLYNFRFERSRHDQGQKTVFGHTGNWDWEDACRLCVENPKHASFFVTKLWSYFIPQAPSASTLKALVSKYKKGNYAIRPVVEAILVHPDFYEGPPMVKPPVPYLVGLLRSINRYIDSDNWYWLCEGAGQQLFWPPNVSGWDHTRWLDTTRMRARWTIVAYALETDHFDVWENPPTYDPAETPKQAMEKGLACWDFPPMRAEQQNQILAFATDALSGSLANWQQSPYRASRENAVRQLIGVSPDLQLS